MASYLLCGHKYYCHATSLAVTEPTSAAQPDHLHVLVFLGDSKCFSVGISVMCISNCVCWASKWNKKQVVAFRS
jgi:hypothetical protein